MSSNDFTPLPPYLQPLQAPDARDTLRENAEQAEWDKDVDAALVRVRDSVGLPPGSEREIEQHFTSMTQLERERHGRSESQDAWINRKTNPLAWEHTEARLKSEMIQKRALYAEVPRCPAGDPKHHDKTPLDLSRMNERQWNEYKEDQSYWAEQQRKGR